MAAPPAPPAPQAFVDELRKKSGLTLLGSLYGRSDHRLTEPPAPVAGVTPQERTAAASAPSSPIPANVRGHEVF